MDDTERFLDGAVGGHEVVDMQQVFLELTTRLMGKVAYDVGLGFVAASQNTSNDIKRLPVGFG